MGRRRPASRRSGRGFRPFAGLTVAAVRGLVRRALDPGGGDRRLPTLKEVKYVQSRDECIEQYYSPAQLATLYDELLYQITLRTVHELFEADVINAVGTVVFNGWVRSINRSTGQEVTTCILSLQVQREEFMAINLANVEPKACCQKNRAESALSVVKNMHRCQKILHPLSTRQRSRILCLPWWGSLQDEDNLQSCPPVHHGGPVPHLDSQGGGKQTGEGDC